MLNLSLNKISNGTISSPSPWLGDEGVHTFQKCIGSKVIVIARLEFELNYFIVTVQLVNVTVTPRPQR